MPYRVTFNDETRNYELHNGGGVIARRPENNCPEGEAIFREMPHILAGPARPADIGDVLDCSSFSEPLTTESSAGTAVDAANAAVEELPPASTYRYTFRDFPDYAGRYLSGNIFADWHPTRSRPSRRVDRIDQMDNTLNRLIAEAGEPPDRMLRVHAHMPVEDLRAMLEIVRDCRTLQAKVDTQAARIRELEQQTTITTSTIDLCSATVSRDNHRERSLGDDELTRMHSTVIGGWYSTVTMGRSLADRLFRQARHEAPENHHAPFMARLTEGGGRIVSAADCAADDVMAARERGDYIVDDQHRVYVLLDSRESSRDTSTVEDEELLNSL